MDHNHMSMASSTVAAVSATVTDAAAAATSAAMDMEMDMGGGCQISMLWNWNVMDACFISSSWHITSKGMFAGSCIGVVLLVMTLEALRRGAREYDRYIIRQAALQQPSASDVSHDSASSTNNKSGTNTGVVAARTQSASRGRKYRPNPLQQLIRAFLHCAQFTVAYFIMLLAMYYNGYIIICIIIGAFLGSFVCSWEWITLGSDDKQEATMCCG
ncbi:Ctr copper transporter family-domain-containing protein [Bisporella sp. PMI_857]|nr:Ctr copper transporter family-domain-containing protein [Bisporella sp. PMI_857]